MSFPPDDPPRDGVDLDDALDALPEEGGRAEVFDARGRAEVDVTEVGRLGVRVRRLAVGHAAPRDVVREANDLPRRLRRLGEEVEPVEVDPKLKGAILRTRPDELEPDQPEFFEVGVRPDEAEIRRYRVAEDGARHEAEWTMTREQLRRLVDDLRDD